MQKDFHFYLTYAVARKIGIDAAVAERIAWADQYTDELSESEVHGIQTQSAILGNWEDPQIQLTVLVPFHFVPGDDPAHPWKTTADSPLSRHLVDAALASKDPIRLGIALHAHQDTFSHQSFSGWREELNSCYSWYSPVSSLPNVGHAEMRATPDIVNAVWTDPRTNQRIDNKARAMDAARATYRVLERWHGPTSPVTLWADVKRELTTIFAIAPYQKRKQGLIDLSGNPAIRYSEIAGGHQRRELPAFIAAAAAHLSDAVGRLPWTPPAAAGATRTLAFAKAAPTSSIVPLAVRVTPNPFNDALRISVSGSSETPVLTVQDRLGHELHSITGDGTVWKPGAEVPTGSYEVKVAIGDRTLTKAVFFQR